ncbi:MAG: EpsG family protein [Sarcina sp.]
MIYICILGVLALLTVGDELITDNIEMKIRGYKAIKTVVFWGIIAFLILFSGLRFFTGLDFITYRWMFDMSKLHIRADHVEYGYYFLNLLIGKFTNNPQWIYLVMATATLLLKATFIKKGSKKIYLSLFIYFSMFFLVYDMGQMRSSLAQAIGFIGILFYLRGQKKISIVFILLGSIFHSSELILLLIFVFGEKYIESKKIIIGYIIFLILGQLLNLHNIGTLAGKFPTSHLAVQINHYTTNPIFASKIGLSFSVIFDFLMVMFILIFRKIYNINDKRFNFLSNMYILGVYIFLLFNNYSVLGIRLGNYFKLSIIILIPLMLGKIESKKIKYLILFIFIGLFSIMVLREISVNHIIYLPYKANLFGTIITI